MRITRAVCLSPALLLVAAGCSTAPQPDMRSESACLERLAAGVPEDGCGVFVAGPWGSDDDANPGTRDTPVESLRRGVELARTGRGRIFVCNHYILFPPALPSGVDLIGGFNCSTWEREPDEHPILGDDYLILSVVPPSIGDTGAADGVSTIVDMDFISEGPIGILVNSNTAVELIRSRIRTTAGRAGRDGYPWPSPNRGRQGPDGQPGGDACSAATVPGGDAVVNPCDGEIQSIGGQGGHGLPDGAEDGEDGQPRVASDPTSGRGGEGDVTDTPCEEGQAGLRGEPGAMGAAGEGIGRITPRGWEGDRAGDGGTGMPGQGGGGGGGRRGGLAVCGVASKGGTGGGSGGAGGCGGRGGRGGENGHPTIGIVALHAKLTVRDTLIWTGEGGPGGNGGPPEEGGPGGRGAPGGALDDGTRACDGGDGGDGGPGGYGGPGRGGDSIGIAYLDEDQLTLEGVTYDLGAPGKGGVSWDWSGDEITGEDGIAVETLRFPE